MFNGKYIELQELMYRIRRHPLLSDVEEGDVAYDAIDVLKLVGAPVMYESMFEILTVSEYRAEIPCELLQILSVGRITDNDYVTPLVTSTSTRGGNWKCASASGLNSLQLDTYSIKRGYIYFDFEEGRAEINYKAIATDDAGFPMIPDNTQLIKAIEAAIRINTFSYKVDMGEMPQHALQRAEQDYAWYIGAAQGALLMPDIDEMEAIKNSLIRIIHDTREHNTGFRNQSQDGLSIVGTNGVSSKDNSSGTSAVEEQWNTASTLSMTFYFDVGELTLDPITIQPGDDGLYDKLTVDADSIGGVININGTDTPVPFTLGANDIIIPTRTDATLAGWVKITN